jgi:hypothetical protein
MRCVKHTQNARSKHTTPFRDQANTQKIKRNRTEGPKQRKRIYTCAAVWMPTRETGSEGEKTSQPPTVERT